MDKPKQERRNETRRRGLKGGRIIFKGDADLLAPGGQQRALGAWSRGRAARPGGRVDSPLRALHSGPVRRKIR
jgi:hypothetical protein